MSDDQHRELSFDELEAAYAKSYEEVFDKSSFMDESELEVLLTKEEKEAKARWADLHALQAKYPDARDFLSICSRGEITFLGTPQNLAA